MTNSFSLISQFADDIGMLETELRSGLKLFWQHAARVLEDSSIRLVPPDNATFSLTRNFFSALFLYSYYRAGMTPERRILYAAVNQCLRGMVTGCDNILDNEYKTTLETSLPPQAHRFRSVLDIMVADRVLFSLVSEYCQQHALATDIAVRAGFVSLQALTESGFQEASEEGGVDVMLAPEDVLRKVHHYKTGLLFQCTWAVPPLLEPELSMEAGSVRDALYQIGIGCQILDDMVDLFDDLRDRKHNYVASVIASQEPPAIWQEVRTAAFSGVSAVGYLQGHPAIGARLTQKAFAVLENGLALLFLPRHHNLIRPAALFIGERIGVSGFEPVH